MKKVCLYIVIVFFSIPLVAQEIEIIENPVTFHVKLGTWVKIPKSVKALIKSNEVEIMAVTQGQQEFNTIYTMSAYECHREAAKHIQYYVDKGYKDAFVIAFDRGQRISSAEAKQKTKTICN